MESRRIDWKGTGGTTAAHRRRRRPQQQKVHKNGCSTALKSVHPCRSAPHRFPPLMLEGDEVVDSARDQSDRQARRRSGLAYLEVVARQFENHADVSTLCVEANSVVEAIFDAANRKKADLLAMASHGWGGSVRTFYGSVASGVINKADQPLLIVRSRSFPEPG